VPFGATGIDLFRLGGTKMPPILCAYELARSFGCSSALNWRPAQTSRQLPTETIRARVADGAVSVGDVAPKRIPARDRDASRGECAAYARSGDRYQVRCAPRESRCPPPVLLPIVVNRGLCGASRCAGRCRRSSRRSAGHLDVVPTCTADRSGPDISPGGETSGLSRSARCGGKRCSCPAAGAARSSRSVTRRAATTTRERRTCLARCGSALVVPALARLSTHLHT
jgi:hypothetical protein